MITRLLPFIAVLLAIGIFFMYIKPAYSGDISAAKTQIDSYDNALAAAQKFSAKQAQLTRERAAIPADSLARLEAFLPDSVNNIQLILDLDALAARSGLALSNFNIDESATKAAASNPSSTLTGAAVLQSESPLDSIDISLSATGTYSAFRTFLSGVERSLRPLDVVQLSVQDSSTGVYTYMITLRIYWLK